MSGLVFEEIGDRNMPRLLSTIKTYAAINNRILTLPLACKTKLFSR
jgi:hypothetical protein